MKIDKDSKGHQEQEVLIRALVMHTKSKVSTSEGVLIGWMRMSIAEIEKKYDKTIKEMKFMPEIERDSFLLDVLNSFFAKTGLDHKKRTTLKYDSLQIYERWKTLYRKNQEAVAAAEKINEKNVPKAQEDLHEEDLLGEFDSLDLDGFDELFE